MLHDRGPTARKDANRKTELVVALGVFRALVSFRPQANIAADTARVSELVEACLPTVADAFLATIKTGARGVLKDVFTSLMGAPAVYVAVILARLVRRLRKFGEGDVSAKKELFLNLHA